MIRAEQLVAHRGFPKQYPENSLPGFKAAIEAGAMWLEWDVQLSADLAPVVIHDTSLERTAQTAGDVRKIQASELSRVQIGQLAEQGPVFIPGLEQAIELVAGSPKVSVFVELKTESIDYFGRKPVLKAILPILAALGNRAVLISFDSNILNLARDAGHPAVGWVIKNPNAEARSTAQRLEPDFLFLNRRKVWAKSGPLWSGNWRWAAYTADTLKQANKLIRQGFEWVETNDIGGMIEALADGKT